MESQGFSGQIVILLEAPSEEAQPILTVVTLVADPKVFRFASKTRRVGLALLTSIAAEQRGDGKPSP
jgi:hypothetical protein